MKTDDISKSEMCQGMLHTISEIQGHVLYMTSETPVGVLHMK